MIINNSDDDLNVLQQELKEQINQKKINEQIVSKSQKKWFEKTIGTLSQIDESFEPLQAFIAKTLGIE